MYAKIKLNLRLELRFHNDFTKKIVRFAEQTNVKKTYLFFSLLRLNCNPVQSFTSHEFHEHIFSSLYFFITTYAILRMLISIVIAQPLGGEQKTRRKTVFMKPTDFSRFPCIKYVLAKPSTSINLKILNAIFTDTRYTSHPCE